MTKKLAQIFHFDSFWKREEKYDKLTNTDFQDVPWQELNPQEPYYFFVPKDFWAVVKYDDGFSVCEIFKEFNSWIQTKNDKLSIQFEKKDLEKIVFDFQNLPEDELAKKYDLKNTSWWNVLDAKNDLTNNKIFFTDKNYRPFDIRHTLYTWKSSGFIWRPRTKESKYMINDNLSIITCRNQDFQTLWFASKYVSDMRTFSNPGSMWTDYFFPLYLYQETQDSLLWKANLEKTPNFNPEIISKIEQKLWMKLVIDFTPEDLFDYIYAVLHSKTYRETYKEFLKIDFPKVPFDTDKATFFRMVKLGSELRSYHLMENENLVPKNFITKYEVDWDNLVEKVRFEIDPETSSGWQGCVFINDTEYFSWVPKQVWEFYIWGYQPAQKWLKDRKDRKLDYEDIIHFSKIILCLKETIRIMEEIEGVFKV